MDPRDLEEDRIVITKLKIVEAVPVFENEDTFTTVVRIELNSSGSGSKDDVNIKLFVGDEEIATQKVEFGKKSYDFTVELKSNEVVRAEVSGEQYLPTDVYYYEPVGGRDTSQSLVGVAGGMTDVYSAAEATLEVEPTSITGDVYLRKVNREGEALTGAAFDLYVEGETGAMLNIGTYSVNGAGELVIEDLFPGKYELRETTAPTGYLEPEETIVFTIDENGSVSLASSKIATFKDGVIVVENEPDKTSVKVNKVWKDEEDAYGVRPDSVKVKLLADGADTGKTAILSEENGWSASFDDLPVKVNDKRVSYTIVEDEVASYISAVTGNMANGFTVTNTYNFTKISIDVNKVWDDDDNENGIRPESVTVKLLADGVDTGKTAVLSEENGWSASFEKLDFTKDGVKINYTVEEVAVEGYVPFITGNEIEGFVVTNVPENDLTDISVYKSWIDYFDRDGIRPDNITVKLLANGEFTGETLVLSENNNWSGKFTNLYRYVDGVRVEYTVEEIDVPGYRATVIGNAAIGFYITNVRENDRTSVDVKKIWDDADDEDGIRPDKITVKLLANGADTGKKIVLRERNNWSGSFTDLETSKDGVEINYTVEEIYVPGYKTVITGNASYGFVITNTHEIEKTEVDVKKVWDDNDDADGLRPEKITVKLYANGAYTGKSAVLNEENSWSASFTDLKANSDGVKIDYTVKEVEVKGYISEVTEDGENSFVITNTRAIGKTDIKVKKVWDDNNNADGIRPRSVTVKLFADGVDTGLSAELSARNGWTHEFRNLDIAKDDVKINYTIEEVAVEGYTTVITNYSEYGFIVTNTRRTEKVDVAGEKIWNDGDNADGMRPESITVNLLSDGEVIDSLEITEEDGWKYSFTDLPKYEGDREIVYTISEVEVEGYTTVIDGFNVINTRESEEEEEKEEFKLSIPVLKIWDDDDDAEGLRPESITVYLYADGELIDSIVITEADGWTFTFDDLPKYNEDGSEIEYTLSEVAVGEYESEITGSVQGGFVITNTYYTELEEEDVPLAPQTGDDALTMILIMVVSSVIICSVAVYRRKKEISFE